MKDKLLEQLLDPENADPVILVNEKGEELAFEQVALIPLVNDLYVILTPVTPIDGVGEGEGLVFRIGNTKGKSALYLVDDEAIVDEVFAVYDQFAEEQ